MCLLLCAVFDYSSECWGNEVCCASDLLSAVFGYVSKCLDKGMFCVCMLLSAVYWMGVQKSWKNESILCVCLLNEVIS